MSRVLQRVIPRELLQALTIRYSYAAEAPCSG